MKPSAWRSSNPPEASGRGPTVMLLNGIGLAIIGGCSAALAWGIGISQMRGGDPPSPIFEAIQLVGFLAIPIGGATAALSVAWWIWRVARAALR